MKKLLCLMLVTGRLVAGEASGGGTPEVSLVDCRDTAFVGASIGQETTKPRATVIAKSLTAQPVTKAVKFEFLDDRVHFFSQAGADEIHLYLNREPTDGVFEGTLSLGTKSIPIACSRLTDHFRPMDDRDVSAEFLHGGHKCFPGGQCVGYIGGLIPTKKILRLKFNIEKARLEGSWREEKEVFDQMTLFDLTVTQRRGQPLVHELKVALKDNPNATTVVVEGSRQSVRLETAALPVGDHTLRVWQKAKIEGDKR